MTTTLRQFTTYRSGTDHHNSQTIALIQHLAHLACAYMTESAITMSLEELLENVLAQLAPTLMLVLVTVNQGSICVVSIAACKYDH